MNPVAPQPLLSRSARAAGFAGALAIIAATVAFAGHASENAVHSAQLAISPAVRYIVLQPVEIVARRTGEPMAQTCVPSASPT